MNPTQGVYLVFRKKAIVLYFRLQNNLSERSAEFLFTELRSGARQYTCEYCRKEIPDTMSQPSNVLLLLVTGEEELLQSDLW
jgi:hypothetical protein